MRVDRPAAVRVDERLRQDRAEPGDGDEVDVVALQRVDDVVRVGDPVEVGAEVGAFDEFGCDTVFAGDVEGAARAVGDHRNDRQLPSEQGLRMVPLPDARTPTRILGHPIPRRRNHLSEEIPRSRPERCFTSLDTREKNFMADQQSPTPGEITIMVAGGVMIIFSFLHFAGGRSAWAVGPSRSRRSSPCTAW